MYLSTIDENPKKAAMLRSCYNRSQDVLHICTEFTTLTHNWLTYAEDWLQLAKPHSIRISQEPWTSYDYNHEIQHTHRWPCQSSSQSAFLELHSWLSGFARPGVQASHTHHLSMLSLVVAICGHAKLMSVYNKAVEREGSAVFLGRLYMKKLVHVCA